MKMNSHCGRRYFAALFLLIAAAAPARSQEITASFPHEVPFESGDAEFAPGDRITIEQIRGTRETIVPGETYSVEGTYTLASREEAELALFATTSNPNPTPVDPRQTVRVRKGSGHFRLIKTVSDDGYLHVSFYPVPSGSDFGGIYFGQGKWVLHHKTWSSTDGSFRASAPAGAGRSPADSLAGANRALLEYLGDPVEPPAGWMRPTPKTA